MRLKIGGKLRFLFEIANIRAIFFLLFPLPVIRGASARA
jgi:hypothetical protein